MVTSTLKRTFIAHLTEQEVHAFKVVCAMEGKKICEMVAELIRDKNAKVMAKQARKKEEAA